MFCSSDLGIDWVHGVVFDEIKMRYFTESKEIWWFSTNLSFNSSTASDVTLKPTNEFYNYIERTVEVQFVLLT